MYRVLFIILFTIVSTLAAIPHEMKMLMDTTIDPCDDFYHYSCGNWLKTSTLKPFSKQMDTSYTLLNERNAQVIMEIVKSNHPLVSEVWSSCMEMKTGNKPLQNDLNRIAHVKSLTEFMELAGEFARTGTHTFAKVSIAPDKWDARTNTLHINTAALTLPTIRHYSHRSVKKAYRKYIHHVMDLSGYEEDEDARDIADIVLDIEMHLGSTMNHPTYVYYMSIHDMTSYWPMTIGAYLKGSGMFQYARSDLRVFVDCTHYLHEIEHLIRTIPLDELKLYLAFRMVHTRIQWLGSDFHDVWFQFFGQVIEEKEKPKSREYFCRQKLVEYLPDLMGKYYHDKAFDPTQQQDTLVMIDLFKHVMGQHIRHSTWLNSDAETAAQDKLKKILFLIGQSEFPRSTPLSLSPHDYYTNVYTLLSHSYDHEIHKIGKRVNRKEWLISSAVPNAMYSPHENTITLSSAILQPPFYNGSNVHPARNFGSIGFVIGHELSHSFDLIGRNYDGDGNERRWWKELTWRLYEIRSKCWIHQYSNFAVGEMGYVNGQFTLNENIADTSGLALAWDSYRMYMTHYQREMKTQDEMFFLSFAQTWCSTTTEERMRKLLRTDRHAPNQWRVNGAIMNHPAFATVFQCKSNTRMNPIKKCQLW